MVSDIAAVASIPGIKDVLSLQILMPIITMVVGVILLLLVLDFVFGQSKSEKQRALITDLYVIGMIKQFAKEDQIDLEKEMKEMRRIEKLQKISWKKLDSIVESELSEKIIAKSEQKIEAMNKENKKA